MTSAIGRPATVANSRPGSESGPVTAATIRDFANCSSRPPTGRTPITATRIVSSKIPHAVANPAPPIRLARLRPGRSVTRLNARATRLRTKPTPAKSKTPAPSRAHSDVIPKRSVTKSPTGPDNRNATAAPSTSPTRSSSSRTRPRVHPRTISPAKTAPMTKSIIGQTVSEKLNPHPLVGLALRLRLDDPDLAHLEGRAHMGPTIGLAIEPDDVDDPDLVQRTPGSG